MPLKISQRLVFPKLTNGPQWKQRFWQTSLYYVILNDFVLLAFEVCVSKNIDFQNKLF